MNRFTLKFILLWGVSSIANANTAIEFDEEILKSRGIDASVAQQFAKAPIFLPGKQDINVYVNNEFKRNVDLLINAQGEPCLTTAILESIGLALPISMAFNQQAECHNLSSIWPESEIISKPAQQSIVFFVPEAAINHQRSIDPQDYTYGGKAALLNYTANYMASTGRIRQDMYFVNTEAGINSDNWLLRSAQVYNHTTHDRYRHQYAYAQTTLEKYKKNLQIGQVNLHNSVIGAAKVLGIQLFPEHQLEQTRQSGAVVSGVATESSMVEVYQSGQLIYTTAVPPGPFDLSQFSLRNRTADLHVTLRSINGQNQSFVVPAATFMPSAPVGGSGYVLGLGRYDEEGAKSNPLVASVSKGWALTPYLGLQVGSVMSHQYYALGVNNNASITNQLTLNINNSIAHNSQSDSSGYLFSGDLSYSVNDSLSLGTNLLLQTADYSYLSEAINRTPNNEISNKQRQFGGSVNWVQDEIGTLNASLGRAYDANNHAQDYISASLSRTINEHYLVSATFQRNYTTTNKTEDAFYLRLSIPFERANLSTYLNHVGNHSRMGANYRNYVDRDQNWGIGYEYNDRQHYQSVSANINSVTPYTQIGGNIQRSNDHQSNWGSSLSGGIVWVNEGILFSPYQVKETFGVAKAGEKAFVRLNSSGGTTWTNSQGYAVLPSLDPYRKNAISVDTRTLSRNSDIVNAYKSITPAKGSIVPVTFTVLETRRLMLDVKMKGNPLPVNSVVKDMAGNFLTLATKPGNVFLGDVTPNMQLQIETPDNELCYLELSLPRTVDPTVLYEKETVSCLPKSN